MSEAPRWFKSSYSSMADSCVEVAVVDSVPWNKSSRSSMGDNCVEVGFSVPAAVLVRDTRHRDSTVLAVGSLEWSGWLRSVAREDRGSTRQPLDDRA
jgi:hypothetical protein